MKENLLRTLTQQIGMKFYNLTEMILTTQLKNFIHRLTSILTNLHLIKESQKNEYKLKSKPWISQDIQFLMWERDKIFHQYCKENSVERRNNLYNKYKILRNNLTQKKRDSKIEYYKSYFAKNTSKIANIWKGIRSLIKIKFTSAKDILILDDNGKLETDPIAISNIFNKKIVSMGPKIDEKISQGKLHYSDYLKDIRINNTFFLRPATYKETSDIILHLDLNKSIGPNSLPTFIVKLCTEFFSIYLTKILNISFTTGIFPDLCKLAKVIPIFKKDDPLDCVNYRPISLLPVFSKIFEKIIFSRMYEFLELNKLIYNPQFGFRANHSTNHALISMIESIKSFLDSGDCVAGIFIDLEKAFDTVNHQILCNKLNYYGFRGKINDLLKSFLSNRKQFVSINGYDSSCLEIKCGVPQGSTLGPLLFLLYINDLRFSLRHAITSHFADDTSISMPVK